MQNCTQCTVYYYITGTENCIICTFFRIGGFYNTYCVKLNFAAEEVSYFITPEFSKKYRLDLHVSGIRNGAV